MPIPFNYAALAADLARKRKSAAMISSGNRCAWVVGASLGLRPDKLRGEQTFLDAPKKDLRIEKNPFLAGFFLRAQQLKDRMVREYGAPDVLDAGSAALPKISGSTGVIYLEDAWTTNSDEVKAKLWRMLQAFDTEGYGPYRPAVQPTPSGDHIDLFDGLYLEIYKDPAKLAESQAYCQQFIRGARRVYFWRTST